MQVATGVETGGAVAAAVPTRAGRVAVVVVGAAAAAVGVGVWG